MRTLSLLCGLVLLASPAVAQTTVPAPPVSIEAQVLPPTGDPLTVAPIAIRNTPISATNNCNLAPTPGGTGTLPLINPTSIEMDDPFTAGKVCRVPLPTGLPNGTNYRGTAVFIATTCTVNGVVQSPCRSARSAVGVPPFTVEPILTLPVTPTNLVVRP